MCNTKPTRTVCVDYGRHRPKRCADPAALNVALRLEVDGGPRKSKRGSPSMDKRLVLRAEELGCRLRGEYVTDETQAVWGGLL